MKFPFADVTWHWMNYSDCQMFSQTAHFVDQTFQEYNWILTE